MKAKRLFFLLFTLLLSSCSPSEDRSASSSSSSEFASPINGGVSLEYERKKSAERGEMIRVEAVSASSELYEASHLIDDSGMSGGEAFYHTHTNEKQRESMFISARNEITGSITFAFSSFKALGHLAIWNYNQKSKLEAGVKDFRLSYSEDNFHYHSLGEHTLEVGKGISSYASKIDDEEYYDFGGIKAKFVKIEALSNYGANQFGLSEVRFFSYRNEDDGLLSYSYLDKNEGKNNVPALGVGLCDGKLTANPFYQSATSRKTLVYSLGGQYPIKSISFWNYNDKDHLDYGVKKIEISLSKNGEDYSRLGAYTLPIGTGVEGMPLSLKVDIDDLLAQYIRFSFLSNYGGEYNALGAFKIEKGEGRSVSKDVDLTGMVSSYSSIWSGADGIFSTRLSGDQSIGGSGAVAFNFSDTYHGEIDAISKKRINNYMSNQSFGYLNGEHIDFLSDEHLPIVAKKDESRSSADAFYWLGDSFVIGDTYYVFGLYIAKEGALGFNQVGEDLFAFDIKDGAIDFSSFRNIYDSETNRLSYFSKGKSIIFGSGVFENTVASKALNPDGYIYIYGYMDRDNDSNRRSLVAARVKESEVEDLSKYRYWDGVSFSSDISSSAPLTDNGNVSCELSVMEMNDPDSAYCGKYILVYQDNTIGKDVMMRVSDSPHSPFGEKEILYHCEETSSLNGISQYNAKAHPVLSDDDSIIITYNLNESGSNLNNTNCDIYHPRFLRVRL